MTTRKPIRKRFFILGAMAILCTIAWRGVTYELRESRLRTLASNLRYLQTAIQVYAEDAKKKTGSAAYPASLQDLITENYLHQSDMEKLQNLSPIAYFPPAPAAPAPTVILSTQFEGHSLLGPLQGDIIQKYSPTP